MVKRVPKAILRAVLDQMDIKRGGRGSDGKGRWRGGIRSKRNVGSKFFFRCPALVPEAARQQDEWLKLWLGWTLYADRCG